MKNSATKDAAKFRIFRGADAPGIEESGVERHRADAPGPPSSVLEGYADIGDPGYSHRMLFAGNGMSLLHLWFKSGFVLPRHSHDTNCVYVVVAGTLRIGTNDLGPGDGFFVGASVPYTYAAGKHGVEIIEFRAAEQFYLDLMVKNPAAWEKFMRTMHDKQSSWPHEIRPTDPSSPAARSVSGIAAPLPVGASE